MKHHRLLSLALLSAAAVAVLAASVSAQPKATTMFQKLPFVSGGLSNSTNPNDHPGNAVCFPPTVAFLPYIGYIAGKTSISAADIALFAGISDPPDPPNASEMTPYSFDFLAGKCHYKYSYPNINPGIATLAQIAAQHNPNTYFLISKRNDCYTFDKTGFTDPAFANIEYECEIQFHGMITK